MQAWLARMGQARQLGCKIHKSASMKTCNSGLHVYSRTESADVAAYAEYFQTLGQFISFQEATENVCIPFYSCK
jgi:hypothetical protein